MASCKRSALAKAVVDYCDGDDGAVDGLVSVPLECDFKAALATIEGQVTDCGEITATDVRVAEQIFEGPRTADDRFVWYGYTPGLSSVPASSPEFALHNFAFADTSVNWRDYTANDLVTTLRAKLQGRLELLASASPVLEPYRKSGGKLLMWHGEADGVFPAEQSIHYYDEVAKLSGARTDDFFRLFLAPGVGHCSGGTGPAPSDPLSALVAWVEDGEAPDVLPARRVQGGTVVNERNLCRYPYVQVHDGGPVDQASSFTCGDEAQPAAKVATTVTADAVSGTLGSVTEVPVAVVADDSSAGEISGVVDAVVDGTVLATGTVVTGTATVALPADVAPSTSEVTFRYRGYGRHLPAEVTVEAAFEKLLAPRATRRPAVTGTARIGSVLRATAGEWDVADATLTYQWLRNGTAIAGQTGESYRVRKADLGAKLSLQVRASAEHRAEGTATSVRTSPVRKARSAVAASSNVRKVVRGKRIVLKVKVSADVPVGGRVMVRGLGKVRSTAVKKNGTARIVLRATGSRGKKTVRITYRGNARVAKSSTTLQIRIR
jgi:hypothetical protein